jgi:hypothetical protein
LHRLVTECRAVPRENRETTADISWRDGRGRITQARGRCLDVSERGARVAYSDAITLPAVMQIRLDGDGVTRTGVVRHCTPKGTQYEIGVEFCSPAELCSAFKK